MIDWTELLSQVLMAVLTICLPPLVTIAVKWLNAKTNEIKQQIEQNNPGWGYALEEAAALAVSAAEQSKLAGLIADKKAYAIDIIEKWLEARKIHIDLDLIEAAIEAEVIRQFPQGKKE